MLNLVPHREGTDPGNNIPQIRIHLLHPYSKQRTVAPLKSKKVRDLMTSLVQKVLLTWMPDIFSAVLHLEELDSKQVLIYLQNRRDNNGHREIFLHKGFIEAECLLDINAVVVPNISMSQCQ